MEPEVDRAYKQCGLSGSWTVLPECSRYFRQWEGTIFLAEEGRLGIQIYPEGCGRKGFVRRFYPGLSGRRQSPAYEIRPGHCNGNGKGRQRLRSDGKFWLCRWKKNVCVPCEVEENVIYSPHVNQYLLGGLNMKEVKLVTADSAVKEKKSSFWTSAM